MGSNHILTYRAEYQAGGSWQPFPGLLSLRTAIESGSGVGPFQFGGATLPSADLDCTLAAPANGWLRAPFRAWHSVAIDGAAAVEELIFTGLLLSQEPTESGWSFRAGGWDQRIARQRVRTPLRYKRFLATRTTATSVEDPTVGGARPGLLNELFWRCGGRPADQAASYPSAPFYYRCDGTSVKPEWAWVDGENAWTEALRLAEAAGGQIFMDSQGVIRYVNPLSLAETVAGAPIIADTGPQAANRVLYNGKVRRTLDVETAYNVAVCGYQRRGLGPRQPVYEARFPFRPLDGGQRELAMQWPIAWRNIVTGAVDYVITVEGMASDQRIVAPTIAVLSESAQTLELRVTNPLAEPIQITRLAIEARPLSVLEEGTARYVAARFDANLAEDVERRLDDSIYTQSQAAAELRARLAATFDGTPRPVYEVDGCPWLPGIHVGGYARFYNSRYSLSDIPVRILARELDDSGATMRLRLADVTGLPRLSDLWVVNQTYLDSDQRRTGL
jgi:hypothetical protein